MQREFEEKGEFITQKFTMSSDRDHAHWLKTFPDPMPSTHEMVYQWVEETGPNGKPSRALKFGPAIKGSTVGNPILADLEGASDGDLATIAAEEGIKVTGKMTRAQVIALITKKRMGE